MKRGFREQFIVTVKKNLISVSFIPQKEIIFRSKPVSLQLSGHLIAKGTMGDGQNDIQEN